MGALQSSGIPAGVIGDSTANAIWMAPISVVVFRRDLEQAIMALYDGEMKFEDYEEEMSREQFDNMQACNKASSATPRLTSTAETCSPRPRWPSSAATSRP